MIDRIAASRIQHCGHVRTFRRNVSCYLVASAKFVIAKCIHVDFWPEPFSCTSVLLTNRLRRPFWRELMEI